MKQAALFPGVPLTTSQAQYSLRYAIAALLVHNRLGPKEISPPSFEDAEVVRLLPAIEVVERTATTPAFRPGAGQMSP